MATFPLDIIQPYLSVAPGSRAIAYLDQLSIARGAGYSGDIDDLIGKELEWVTSDEKTNFMGVENGNLIATTSINANLAAANPSGQPVLRAWFYKSGDSSRAIVELSDHSLHALNVNSPYKEKIEALSGAEIADISTGYSGCVILKHDKTATVVMETDSYGVTAGVEALTGVVKVKAMSNAAVVLLDDGTARYFGNTVFYDDRKTAIETIQSASECVDFMVIGLSLLNIALLKPDGTVVYAGSGGFPEVSSLSGVIGFVPMDNQAIVIHGNDTMTTLGASSYSQAENYVAATDRASVYFAPFYTVSGTTNLPDGTPVSAKIALHNADTHKLVYTQQSSLTDGAYSIRVPRFWSVYAVCVYDTGHRPLVHGPITPPPEA